jgi:hypothetical protein
MIAIIIFRFCSSITHITVLPILPLSPIFSISCINNISYIVIIHAYLFTCHSVFMSQQQHQHHKIEMEIIDKSKSSNSEKDESNMASRNTQQNPTLTLQNEIISKTNPIAGASTPVPPSAPPQFDKKECCICFDPYNKSTRNCVICPSCGFEACRKCNETFILDPTNHTPNCMNCHKEFQREFMVENFTLKFVSKDWKEHRERLILQKERALLPTRQPVAEMVRRKDVLAKECNTILEQINALRMEHYNKTDEKNRIERRIRLGPTAGDVVGGSAAKRENTTFVRPCPNTAANCRGFLSTQWKCNLCNMWACKDCHEMKGPAQDTPHECNPDNLASAKLIDAETRACPKCGARVYKISGCNQMFCTACNDCAFDWVTGRIETVIHNPHYYEFQRQRNGGQAPRVAGDILCGREVDQATTLAILSLFPLENMTQNITAWRNRNKQHEGDRDRSFSKAQEKWSLFYADYMNNVSNILNESVMRMTLSTLCSESQIMQRRKEMFEADRMILFRKMQFQEICRIIIEIRQVTLPQYRVDPLRYNEELGVKYLLGELTENAFAIALQRADKKMQKSREIQNILTMVLNTSTDIIFRFADHLRQTNANTRNSQTVTADDFKILDEIRELFKYANRCMTVMCRTYQTKLNIVVDQTLEPNYWEDDGKIIYTKMTEYNRGVQYPGAVNYVWGAGGQAR